jgi:hypothetical protein
MDFDGRITAPPCEFMRISGLGETKTYELINNRSLESIKIGKRRLIVLDSYYRLIKQQIETPPPKTPTPDRRGSRRAG